MKAVDICVARPDVDATRLGVTGGSYGGFMTAWITTKTDRFKAAQADRMIVNWVSWYGNSDAQSLTEGEFLGNPVAELGLVHQHVADQVRRQGEDADADRAVRGGLSRADRRRRAVVHGAAEAQRAGRVRALSALEPRPVAHAASRGC